MHNIKKPQKILEANTQICQKLSKDQQSLFDLVDEWKSKYQLEAVLSNQYLFDKLRECSLLNHESCSYILNALTQVTELERLIANEKLLRHMLKNFLFTVELDEKYSKLLKDSFLVKYDMPKSIYKFQDFFSCIEFCYATNYFKKIKHSDYSQEILALSARHKAFNELKSFALTSDEKLKIVECIENNRELKNKLSYVIENKLESIFENFEELLAYLNKQDKRYSLNI